MLHSVLEDSDSAPASLNWAQARTFQNIYETYPTVRICRDLIRQYVFERPMICTEDLDQEVYRQLGKDMFDQVMVLGVAIVRAKPGTVPCIIPWELCRVTVTVDAQFNRIMQVYPARMMNQPADAPIPHAYVLDVFGFSPTLQGNLNGLMRPLHFKIEMINDQMDCAIAADRARARPPCFSETTGDTHNPANEVTYDYYADATSVQRTSMNTYMRNQGALERLEAQQQNLRTSGGRTDGTTRERVASHNVSTAVKNAIDSITPMPIGQKVARGPDCHAPDQLVDRMRFIEQEIFVLLGVPRSFCMHDMTVRHDAGMLHCTLTRTVHMWQEGIAAALSFVFNVTNNGPPKKRKRLNVEKVARERNATLRFERMPRVSVQELTFAYDKGVIDWKAFQRNMATFCGMDDDDLMQGKDPWKKEERMAMLGGGGGAAAGGAPKTEFAKDPRGGGI